MDFSRAAMRYGALACVAFSVAVAASVAAAACVPSYAFESAVDGGADAAPTPTGDAGRPDATAGDAAIPDGAIVDATIADAGSDANGVPPYDAGGPDALPDAMTAVRAEGRLAIGGSYPYLTLCLVSSGVLSCMGDNESGQLGRGPDAGAPTDLEPVQDPDGGAAFGNVTRVLAGDLYECAQRADQVFCWGDNGEGEIGQASSQQSPYPAPVPVLSTLQLEGVQYFAAGGYSACAVLGDGGVSCWGSNGYDQLCQPSGGLIVNPATPISAFVGARDIAFGTNHTCAAMEPDGRVVCCGLDDERQAGQAEADGICLGEPCVPTATVVDGVLGARQVALGAHHSCALIDDGSIACWGENDHGQLGGTLADAGSCGDAGIPCSESPVGVRPPTGNFIQVAVGTFSSCGLVDVDGSVLCWGLDQHGELGHGGSGPDTTTPVPVETAPGTALTGMTSIVGGDTMNCAVSSTGASFCWGLWNQGGEGFPLPYATPTPP